MTRREQLIEAIRALSRPADEQVLYFTSIGLPITGKPRNYVLDVSADELLLSYGDKYLTVGFMVENGELTCFEQSAIDSFDKFVREFDDKERCFTISKLYESSDFDLVRTEARRLLKLFEN